MVVGIKAVLDETGNGGQDFVTGIEQCFQGHIKGSGGAAGHNDVGFPDGYALLFSDMPGDSLSDMRVSRVGHIAVFTTAGAGRFREGFVKAFRGRYVRISEAKVKYVVRSVLGLEAT